MDNKEKKLLETFKEKFKNNSFEETDMYGFLILIRKNIKNNRYLYKYIIEFCDLVAHRERNRGIIMDNITQMIEKRYYINKEGVISGFCSIDKEEWIKEWKILSRNLKLKLTERNIDEITMCIFSLASNSIYNNEKHRGVVKILLYKNNQFCLACTVGRKDSRYVGIVEYENFIKNINDSKISVENMILIRDVENNLIAV